MEHDHTCCNILAIQYNVQYDHRFSTQKWVCDLRCSDLRQVHLPKCCINLACSSTLVNVYTTCNSMHKMWFFAILKLYFHHKNVKQFKLHLDRLVLTTVKFRPIKVCYSGLPWMTIPRWYISLSGICGWYEGLSLPGSANWIIKD